MSYLSVSREGYLIAEESQLPYIDEMVEAYRIAIIEINAKLEKQYAKLATIKSTDFYAYMTQKSRLESLKAEVVKVYKEASKAAWKATQKGLEIAMTENYNRQLYLSNWLVPNKVAAIPTGLVKYSVTGNIKYWNDITKSIRRKIGDNPGVYAPQVGSLSDLLNSNYTKELDKILQSIENGLILGKGYKEQAKVISETIGTYIRSKGVERATGATYKALRIARTEGQRVLNTAAIAQTKYLESEGVKVQKQWLATLDMNTRDTHQGLDGQRVGVDEEFSYGSAAGQAPGRMNGASENINCRCSTITIIDGESPSVRTARNPVPDKNGKYKNETISFKSYKEWVKEHNI